VKWLWLLLLPGGSLIVLGIWLRQRWLAREAEQLAATLAAKGETLRQHQARQHHDQSKAVRAAERRAEANKKRREAIAIASGELPKVRLVRAQR
jgi:hypothetical protein